MSGDVGFFKRVNAGEGFRDGLLEVRITDSRFHSFFKKRVGLTDKPGLRRLVGELRNKGVEFPRDWLD